MTGLPHAFIPLAFLLPRWFVKWAEGLIFAAIGDDTDDERVAAMRRHPSGKGIGGSA